MTGGCDGGCDTRDDWYTWWLFRSISLDLLSSPTSWVDVRKVWVWSGLVFIQMDKSSSLILMQSGMDLSIVFNWMESQPSSHGHRYIWSSLGFPIISIITPCKDPEATPTSAAEETIDHLSSASLVFVAVDLRGQDDPWIQKNLFAPPSSSSCLHVSRQQEHV